MTQEDKKLLFQDLCARIPYHVRVKIWLKDGTTEEGPLDLQHNYADVLLDAFYYNKIIDIKPYLRSVSSMTEEEKAELKAITDEFGDNWFEAVTPEERWKCTFLNSSNEIDWLNEHHFDYRGLIEKGLALEAPEGMYNLKRNNYGNN